MSHLVRSTFRVVDVAPTDYAPPVEVGVPVGHASLTKEFTGAIVGRSVAQFSSAFSMETGVGTYVALEVFSGTFDGRDGTFAFAHTATTDGANRSHHLVVIVPSSGTGGLVGLTGTGELVIDADGTHHLDFDVTYDDAGAARQLAPGSVPPPGQR
ncbi:MAG: DUF3224 domain-containing protein [Dermatophilaceae bacterium]